MIATTARRIDVADAIANPTPATLHSIYQAAHRLGLTDSFFHGGGRGCDLAVIVLPDGTHIAVDDWAIDSDFHANVADGETSFYEWLEEGVVGTVYELVVVPEQASAHTVVAAILCAAVALP